MNRNRNPIPATRRVMVELLGSCRSATPSLRRSRKLCAAALLVGIGPAQADLSTARILRRLDALERENIELRSEVEQEKQELQNFSQKVEASSQSQSAQVTELNQKVTASEQAIPKLESQVDYVEQRQSDQPVKVGFRTGWSESPYAMPGGFFYSAYLADRLLSHEDNGIPGDA